MWVHKIKIKKRQKKSSYYTHCSIEYWLKKEHIQYIKKRITLTNGWAELRGLRTLGVSLVIFSSDWEATVKSPVGFVIDFTTVCSDGLENSSRLGLFKKMCVWLKPAVLLLPHRWDQLGEPSLCQLVLQKNCTLFMANVTMRTHVLRPKSTTCRQPRAHTVSKPRCMYGYIHTVHAQYRCKYTLKHTHTHTHTYAGCVHTLTHLHDQ